MKKEKETNKKEESNVRNQNRREFIKSAAVVTAGLSLPLMNSCNSDDESEEEKEPISNEDDENSNASDDNEDNENSQSDKEDTKEAEEPDSKVTEDEDNKTSNIEVIDDEDSDPSSEGSGDSDSEPDEIPEVNVDGGIETGEKTLVSLVRNGDILAAVREAIELAGGLDAIKGGDKVCIKPNLTTGSAAVTTSKEVMRGVLQAVATRTDPANITVGECSAFGGSARSSASATGLLQVCNQEKVNFLDYKEHGQYTLFSHPKWKHIKDKKRVPTPLNPMSFDHFINVPILKNHEMSGGNQEFTCCMKLFVGLLPFNGNGSREKDNIHTEDLGEKVAELGLIVPKTVMNVVDALHILLTNGPTGPGVSANPKLILASSDRVACDSVAVAVLKLYGKKKGVSKPYVNKSVWKQAQIQRAREIGLGAVNPELIELVQQGVDNFDEIKKAWV